MTPNNPQYGTPWQNPNVGNRPNSLLRAIRGPILMITLGALVSIDFAGRMSFARTWPMLMIVYGVLRLAEHLTVNQAGPGNQGGN